jgi:hypothetical protein
VVGAWGPAIFSDDLACDVRRDYRDLLEDQVADDEATRRVIESYRDVGGEDEPTFWLVLAATQTRLGRLDAAVKARALEVIDQERGLDVWEEAGVEALARRREAFAKLRLQLVGPQPERKAIRRQWRYVTDLEVGDVLGYRARSGIVCVLRVARVHDAPILELLNWAGTRPPDTNEVRSLRLLRPNTRFCTQKYRKRDPDWRECGLVLQERRVAAEGGLAAGEALDPWVGVQFGDWERLVETLEMIAERLAETKPR